MNSTHQVTVMVQQKGEITEPTVLAVRLTGDKDYTLRLPIDPGRRRVTFPESHAKIEPLPDHRVRVTVDLPRPPEQIAVDPDGVLLDRDPTNNVWRPEVHWRLTPLYTFLDETDLTCASDRWNLIAGPWAYDADFNDPWFTRATVLGGRIGAYKTQEFQGGVYAGWRPDYRDLAAGVDLTLPHWPFPEDRSRLQPRTSHRRPDRRRGGPQPRRRLRPIHLRRHGQLLSAADALRRNLPGPSE